jgi:hypothetical protein
MCIAYATWMTGGTFVFRESDLFPNYNMLANAFAKGQSFIDETPPEDHSVWDGKRYLYFGPIPALIRMPVTLVFGRSVPTGLMIALFCAGCAVLFVMTMNELTLAKDASDALLKVVFALLFAFNGVSLLMTEIPTIHHEAIAVAMFFLMVSIYLLARTRKRGKAVSPGAAALMGLSLSCCVASRATYLLSCVVIAVVFVVWIRSRLREEASPKSFAPVAAIVAIMTCAGCLLLVYNYARFGDPLEFGMKYQMSVYRDYLLAGNFIRYEHIPYNLWSIFCRLPVTLPEFPFLVLPRFVLETRSIAFMPYHLTYANELSVSVFVLMPALLLSGIPLIFLKEVQPDMEPRTVLVLSTLVVTQIFPLVVSMSTVARYYYDFVPIMMMLSFLGGLWLTRRGPGYFLVVLLAVILSVVVSFTLPMNAIKFYLES